MSEHDEQQPSPGSWRPAGLGREAPAAGDGSSPPWASPGFGQPFPGEERPADQAPRAAGARPWHASDEPARPSHGAPSYQAPEYPPPSFPTPSYQVPDYPPPNYQVPNYPAQNYAAPDYASQNYPALDYPPQNYRAPDYSPLKYQTPAYGQPYPGELPQTDDPAFAYPYRGYPPPAAYPPDTAGWQGGWQGGYQPPPSPPPYGSWGPAPGPGWAPQSPPPRSANPFTIILVAIVIAAVVGLALGGQLVRRNSNSLRLPSVAPAGPPATSAPSGVGVPPAQAEAIAAAVDPSIVDINTKLAYQRAAAAGTGMILTSDGQVLTNNHVIAGATSVTGMVVGGKSYTAHVVGTDPTEDVALIKLDNASGLRPITTGDPTKLTVGQPIVAVGNAGGVGGTPSVVTGTVEALDQSVTASDMGGANAETLSGLIEINAPLQPGDSGGPLISTNSQVVGMNTAASASSRVESQSSVGFAIPITKAIAIAHEIAAGHASATIQIGLPGFLGVGVSPNATGATLSNVLAGGPAEKAGLTAGDVITSVNGQSVDSGKTLTTILQQRHPGDKVVLGWTDPAGKKHTGTITLTTGPAA